MADQHVAHLREAWRAGLGGRPMPPRPADPEAAALHRERALIHRQLAALEDHLAALAEAGG